MYLSADMLAGATIILSIADDNLCKVAHTVMNKNDVGRLFLARPQLRIH